MYIVSDIGMYSTITKSIVESSAMLFVMVVLYLPTHSCELVVWHVLDLSG